MSHRVVQPINALLSKMHLKLVHARAYPDKVMDDELAFLYEKVKPYTMTSKERMYALYKAVEYVIKKNIPGDFVECGVWRGGSSMIIALTLLKFGVRGRKIYLYDTYEGMSEPTAADKSTNAGYSAMSVWKKEQTEKHNEWCYASLDDVQKNMFSTGYPRKQIFFVKGKVEDTIPKTIPKQISLLRLDTDWYESTKHELIHLHPRLVKGGVLLIDDYGGWEGARKAVDEYFAKKPILLCRVDGTARISLNV